MSVDSDENKRDMRILIAPLANELDIGESKRMNHADCPAGVDTRRRLYVTRKADVLLGYCHNCGVSTSMYLSTRDRFRNPSTAVMSLPLPAHKPYRFPTTVRFDEIEELPIEANAWLIQSNISRTEANDYGIKYVPENNSILIPFFRLKGFDYNGYQLRPLDKHATAKYVNCVKYESEELGGITRGSYRGKESRCVVIVEDLVSAIHINRLGCPAYVNYGTQVKPIKLHHLSKEFDQVLVWLDNDKPEVIEKARQMTDVLTLFMPMKNVHRSETLNDPKHYEHKILKEELNGYFGS